MTIKKNSRGSHDKAVPEMKVKKKMKIIKTRNSGLVLIVTVNERQQNKNRDMIANQT